MSSAPTLTVTRGALVQEVTQRWSSWLSQVVRLYVSGSQADVVELEWTVGPVDIEDGRSKEVVTKYLTDLDSQGRFVTDSNGREFQPRVRDRRPTWNWTNVSPVAGNYYPLSTGVVMDDGQTGLGVLVDRAHGASSLQDGNLEIMIHRRILYACALSVTINETGPDGRGLVITGSHRLLMGPVQSSSTSRSLVERMRLQQQQLFFPVRPVFAAGSPASLPSSVSFVAHSLPPHVELMTLQRLTDGRVLLRLAHSFAVNESLEFSQPVSVNLSTLFVPAVSSVRRVTLTANADYRSQAEAHQHAEETEAQVLTVRSPEDAVVTLAPMQIATFVIELKQIG